MKNKFDKLIIIFFLLLGIVVGFQNCAPRFKSLDTSSMDENQKSMMNTDQFESNEISSAESDQIESIINSIPTRPIIVPPPSAPNSLNNDALAAAIDDIQADMQLNEAPLLNAPIGPGWTIGAIIEMGGAPRGDATPYWWKPTNLIYKSATPWSTFAPWFVIYPGVNNAAKNVRVKVYGLKVYILKKSSNKWIKIDTGTGKPVWAGNYGFNLTSYISDAPARVEPDGQLSYKLNTNSNPVHGGLPKIDMTPYIDPMDVGSVITYIKTQLILDNPAGVDDRASAQILFNVGTDYYPTMSSKMIDFSPMSYVPSVGGSRYGLVRTTPRMRYMATIDPAPKNISKYTLSGGLISIPVAQLAANMPADLTDAISPTTPTSVMAKLTKGTGYASVALSWGASTDNVGVGGYYVYRDGVKMELSTVTNYTNYILGNPTGTTHTYTVKAFDDLGNLSPASIAVKIVY